MIVLPEDSVKVIAIDPGHVQSAWVEFYPSGIVDHAIEPNEDILRRLNAAEFKGVDRIVFEQIESFGMAVGREVFETVFWTGRLFEAALRSYGSFRVHRMTRKAVKLNLCHTTRANDSNVRVAIVDRFGGAERAIGKKRTPGPLYGIKSHEWSALAIALTSLDARSEAHA